MIVVSAIMLIHSLPGHCTNAREKLAVLLQQTD